MQKPIGLGLPQAGDLNAMFGEIYSAIAENGGSMSQRQIGLGLPQAGDLNAMFTEIYAAVAGGVGGSALTYTAASVPAGAASGASAGSLSTTLTGTVSYSVLSGAVAVNSSTGALTTTATAGSSGTISAKVRAATATDAIEKTIAVPIQAAAATAPAAPTLAATPGNGQISLAWTDGSTGGAAITSHNLYEAATAGGEAFYVGNISTVSPYVDTGLPNGTARYYRLSAVNSVGESALSNEVSATPVGAGAPVAQTAPSISGLAASGNTLTATAGTYTGASSVAGQWQKNGVAISGATGLTYTCGTTDGPNIAYLETATASGGGATTQRALSTYVGQTATRCRVPNALTTAAKQYMSRTAHFAKEALSSVKVGLANWYWNQNGASTPEAGTGGTATYTASIEYPAGTFTQVKFGGNVTSPTVADNTTAYSDFATVSIPAGAQFWIRVFCQASVGIPYTNALSSPATPLCANSASGFDLGEGCAYAASGIADQTMGGTITPTSNSATSPIMIPVAILSPTTRPSVYVVGDSRGAGAGDVYDSTGDLGEIARSVGASFGYINAGCYGDRSDYYIASHARRVELTQWSSHVVVETAINDLRSASGGNSTAAALESRLQTIYGYFPGAKIFQSTTPPRVSGTYATLGGQTADTNNAARVTFNNDIRATPSPLAGYFEVADVLESARDSGLWKVPGDGSAYTIDGLHENTAGYKLIPPASAIPVSAFTR